MMLRLHPKPKLRIIAMVTLIVMSLLRVGSYLAPSSPNSLPMLAFVGPLIPEGWHAAPWGVAAALGIAALLRSRLEPHAVGTFVGVNVLWGASMFASSLALGESRAWVSAISYLGIAVLTGTLFGMIDPSDAKRMREHQPRVEEERNGGGE